MRYNIDENTIWEDTGKIVVYNYPPSPNTYSYITRLYTEYKTNNLISKIVEGDPIYFHEMPKEQVALAIIIATAENALNNIVERNLEIN